MAGMQDHICSSTCMFCRVLDNPRAAKPSGQRAYLDSQVLDRVKELEQRSILSNTHASLTTTKGDDLERLALLDTLTELYNSRTLVKELKDELKRAKRYKRPVSLCMVSIDGFKTSAANMGR